MSENLVSVSSKWFSYHDSLAAGPLWKHINSIIRAYSKYIAPGRSQWIRSTFHVHRYVDMSAAVVTGAAQGLGRAIALRLADDGFNLMLFDLPLQSEALHALAAEITARSGRSVICVMGDVSAEDDVKRLVATAAEQPGGLDVVSTAIPSRCCADNADYLDGSKRRHRFSQTAARKCVFVC